MPGVLVVSYDYPPCRAPGAAVRSAKFVHYLAELGWRATVVCRDERPARDGPGPGPVIRIGSPIEPRISYQLAAWDWAARIVEPVGRLLRRRKYDLIYASCPPFPPGLSALRLSRAAGLPLVVDFRDAWSLDPFASRAGPKRVAKWLLCRSAYPLAESRLIRGADAFIANTPSARREYARLLGWPIERIHLLPNGFDESDFGPHEPFPARARPRFVYCGRFAAVADRDPGLILHAVRELVDAGVPIELRIVGDDSTALRTAIDRLNLADTVTSFPTVPHAQAIREMSQADVLVLFQPTSRNRITPIAGKTFEYLRSGRPILAIVPEGDNAQLVRCFASTCQLVTSFNPADVLHAMKQLCIESADRNGRAAPEVSGEFLHHYNRRNLTARLAEIFEQVIASHRRRAAKSG